MHSEAQTIARLRSMLFLIEEAMRIADEGDNEMIGAKLSDCIDRIHVALSQIHGVGRTESESRFGTISLAQSPAVLSL